MRPLRWVLACLLICGMKCTALAKSHPYDELFVFGDSYSDIGAGYIDGNGPTSVAYLAKDLGIPLVIPSQATPGKGVDFAVSGARTGAGSGKRFEHGELLSYGMRNQVDDFVRLLKSGKVSFDPKRTMFYFAGGLNDRLLPVDTSVANIEGEIGTLYGLGARRFMVAILPEKIPSFAAQSMRVNPGLERIPAEMRAKYSDIQIETSDWGPFYDRVMEHAARYGITNTTDACAGRALKHQDTTPCASPETYFYYHQGHPSTHTHKIIGEMLAKEARRLKAD